MRIFAKQLNISHLLMAVIGLTLLLSALIAGMSIYNLSQANASLSDIYHNRMTKLAALSDVSEKLTLINAQINRPALNQTPMAKATKANATQQATNLQPSSLQPASLQQQLTSLADTWQKYASLQVNAEEKNATQAFNQSLNTYLSQTAKPALQLLAVGDTQALSALNPAKNAEFSALVNQLLALKNIEQEIAHQDYALSQTRLETLRRFEAVTVVVFMALTILLSVLTLKNLKKILGAEPHALKAVADSVATGRFDYLFTLASHDKTSVMAALKRMQDNLKEAVAANESLQATTQQQSMLYEAQLQAISQSTAVIEFSVDGMVTAANDNFLKAVGYRADEVVGHHHAMFVEAAFAQSAQYREFWATLNQGQFVSGKFKRVGKHNKTVWLEASYNPILDANDQVIKIVKYATDITHEVALGESARVLEMVADETNIAASVTDMHGRIEFVNKGFMHLTGYSFDEVVGKKPGDILQGELTSAETKQAISHAIHHQEAIECEIINYTKQAQPYWINLKINPIFDAQGQAVKFVSLQSNIDATKLNMLDTTARLEAISKSMAIVEFNVDGTVLYANENFCNTVGYRLDEIIGQHHSMFMHEADWHSEEYKAFWHKLSQGIYDANQYRRKHKSGADIWLQASYNPVFDLQNKVIKVVKYATDITQNVNRNASVVSAVNDVQTLVVSAQEGDISQRLLLDNANHDIASLCNGVNALINNMSEVVLQLEDASQTISHVAQDIAEENEDLSKRTDHQSSQIEDTSNEMDKLAGTIWQNAENSKNASQFALEASDIAVKGGAMVERIISTMEVINKSSRKIEDIISVIDGIAFQTNILALNAAVEAARAGEQGRGFAVVAGEVRNLAQRSALAAKEIKLLISDSVGKVQEGVNLVQDAGKTMSETVASVQRVTQIIGEITEASFEQGLGVAQLNNTISSMKEVSQQNTSLVHSISTSVEQLLGKAESVKDMASAYTVSVEAKQAFNQSKFDSQATAETNVVAIDQSPKDVKKSKAKPVKSTASALEKLAVNASSAQSPGWELF